MRPADMKKHIVLAVLAVMAGAAGAQPAPQGPVMAPQPVAPTALPQPPVLQPAAAASAPQNQSMGQKAGGIVIGRVAPPGADSLKDLEALQRQAYFLELRIKMKELNAAPSGDAQSVSTVPAVPAVPPVLPLIPAAGLPQDGEPAPVVDEQPTARVVSLIVTAGRARADVTTNGSVVTVKEGDDLGDGWRVASIKPTGVRAEKVVIRTRRDPDFIAAVKARVGKKPNRPIVAPMVEYEKTLSYVLKPVETFAVAPAVMQVATPAPSVVPPLPTSVRPLDSTSVPPPVALGTGFMPPIAAGLPGSTPR